MLRKFIINVNGQEYKVEMEELGNSSQTEQQPLQFQAAPQPVQEAVPQSAESSLPPRAASSVAQKSPAGDSLTAPMPGTILKILVQEGEQVKENQPLMILEAMKMENEVVADMAGTITGIHVRQGEMVNPGQPVITIN